MSIYGSSAFHVYLSGGSSNSDPDASLGGVKSSVMLGEQEFTRSTSTVTGVTVNGAVGCSVGTGTLSYQHIGTAIAWTPPYGAQGVFYEADADGEYLLPDATEREFLRVTVVSASLPGSDQSDEVAIDATIENLFDNISLAEAQAGHTDYRCVYVQNDEAVDRRFLLWFHELTTGPENLYYGLGSSGLNGTEQDIGTETTAPSSVSWLNPTDENDADMIDQLYEDDYYPIWIKRVVLPYTIDANAAVLAHLHIKTWPI